MAIPRGAVRAVSFDYGHVLGGLDLGELSARLEAHGLRPDPAALRQRMEAAHRAHDQAIAAGRGHEEGWRSFMRALVDVGSPKSASAREAIVEALWRAQPTRNLWRHVPDEARALLSALTDASVPMIVASNSEGGAASLVSEVGIARHFVTVLDSGVLGVAKPDRRFFERAARALGVPIGAVVHVGDSEEADVVGAKASGAWAVRFDGFLPGAAKNPTAADARAASFDELREILATALDRELRKVPAASA